jgi:hypothetical protein
VFSIDVLTRSLETQRLCSIGPLFYPASTLVQVHKNALGSFFAFAYLFMFRVNPN